MSKSNSSRLVNHSGAEIREKKKRCLKDKIKTDFSQKSAGSEVSIKEATGIPRLELLGAITGFARVQFTFKAPCKNIKNPQ